MCVHVCVEVILWRHCGCEVRDTSQSYVFVLCPFPLCGIDVPSWEGRDSGHTVALQADRWGYARPGAFRMCVSLRWCKRVNWRSRRRSEKAKEEKQHKKSIHAYNVHKPHLYYLLFSGGNCKFRSQKSNVKNDDDFWFRELLVERRKRPKQERLWLCGVTRPTGPSASQCCCDVWKDLYS